MAWENFHGYPETPNWRTPKLTDEEKKDVIDLAYEGWPLLMIAVAYGIPLRYQTRKDGKRLVASTIYSCITKWEEELGLFPKPVAHIRSDLLLSRV